MAKKKNLVFCDFCNTMVAEDHISVCENCGGALHGAVCACCGKSFEIKNVSEEVAESKPEPKPAKFYAEPVQKEEVPDNLADLPF